MKRRRILSLFFLIFLFVMMVPAAAFADLEDVDPYQELFNENLGQGFRDGAPLFMKYSLINYRLDYYGDQTSMSGAASTFLLINTILSFCMVGMALAAKLTIDIMTWAFSYNQIDLLIDHIDDIVDRLVDGLFFSELFTIGLFALGISLFFTFSKREDVAGKLLKVIFNLVIAFTLLSNMGLIISYLNKVSQWGSDAVFIAFESVVGSDVKEYDNHKGKNAFFNVSEKFFEYNVHIPWQLGEFGLYVPSSKTTNLTAEEQQLRTRVDQTLRHEVKTDGEGSGNSGLDPARFTNRFTSDTNPDGQAQNNNSSISMSSFGIPFRIFVVWLTFTVGTLYGCLLLALAGTAVICQFLMYLLAIISPLVFLLILVPEWGDQMLIKWLQGLITSAIYKIIASFLLIMILVLQGKIYDVSQGWAYAMFAQVVLVFAVFLFRKNIMEYIPLPGMAAFHYTENTLFDKGKSIVDKTFGTVVDRAKVTVVGAAPTGLATGNPAVISQRESVSAVEQQESSITKRRGVLESLGEMMQSKSVSKSKYEEGNVSNKETTQTTLRRRTENEPTEQSLRKLSSGADGFVRVGEVKEAIDRLASKNQSVENLEERARVMERKPVDVRVVEVKPTPGMLEQLNQSPIYKKNKDLLSQEHTKEEMLETNKRTVTPIVKEEKVEQIQAGRRRIPKLDFPNDNEMQEEQTNQNQTQQEQSENEELDPKQLLEQQAMGPEVVSKEENNAPSVGKSPKKKGGWLNKLVSKLKN